MDQKATAEKLPAVIEQAGYRVRWSGLSLTFDEKTLSALVNRLVERIDDLKDLRVEVSPGELAATLVVHRFGVPRSSRFPISS